MHLDPSSMPASRAANVVPMQEVNRTTIPGLGIRYKGRAPPPPRLGGSVLTMARGLAAGLLALVLIAVAEPADGLAQHPALYDSRQTPHGSPLLLISTNSREGHRKWVATCVGTAPREVRVRPDFLLAAAAQKLHPISLSSQSHRRRGWHVPVRRDRNHTQGTRDEQVSRRNS